MENKEDLDAMDVELGQLNICKSVDIALIEPNSSWCKEHCKRPNEYKCPYDNGLPCLGWGGCTSVKEIWSRVDFAPALLTISEQLSMPEDAFRRLCADVQDMTSQEEACAYIRKTVSWTELMGYVLATVLKEEDFLSSLGNTEEMPTILPCSFSTHDYITPRTPCEMVAIKAIGGELAPMNGFKIEEILKAVNGFRSNIEYYSRWKPPFYADEEIEAAFTCPWSSPSWDRARRTNKGSITPSFVVECPESESVRSHYITDQEILSGFEPGIPYLHQSWFMSYFLFVLDCEIAPAKTVESVLENREVLAFVVDPWLNRLSLCVVTLEKSNDKINWILQIELAYIDGNIMWRRTR